MTYFLQLVRCEVFFQKFLDSPDYSQSYPLASFGAVAIRFEAILWRAAWKFEDHEWFAS